MDLLNTRWMFLQPESQGLLHHVQVAAIFGEAVVVATCYSTPFRTWVVPLQSFIIRPSAFQPLGSADSFEWVHQGAYVHTSEAWAERFPNAPWGGVWAIEQLTPMSVNFAPRNRNGTPIHDSARWYNFLRDYRLATSEEVRAGTDRRGNAIPIPVDPVIAVLEPEPPTPEPAPEPTPQGTGRAIWDHMNEDT